MAAPVTSTCTPPRARPGRSAPRFNEAPAARASTAPALSRGAPTRRPRLTATRDRRPELEDTSPHPRRCADERQGLPMERTLAILLFTGLACGGSSGGLNPAFAKTWVGTSTATITGLQPFTSAGQLTVAVNGDTAHVTGVCPPDGAGAIDAKGSGNSAS